MRRKGVIGWVAAVFAMGVFAALFLFIFLFSFKYHVTMMMMDYYFWGKEYDIPLALFSVDIGDDSSIVAMNKLYYFPDDSSSLRDELQNTLYFWLPETTTRERTRSYSLQFGNEEISKEPELEGFEGCRCSDGEMIPKKCKGGCGTKEGDWCHSRSECLPELKPIKVSYLGIYPLPLVFNGTTRVTELEWSSTELWWIE